MELKLGSGLARSQSINSSGGHTCIGTFDRARTLSVGPESIYLRSNKIIWVQGLPDGEEAINVAARNHIRQDRKCHDKYLDLLTYA